MGLRHRGHGLIRAAAVSLLATLALSCAGLDEQEEARLDVHRENARSFFDRGDYERALHQSTMALQLDDEDPYMHLVRAHSLLRLGSAARNPAMIEDSLAVFDELYDDAAYDDRVPLGLGSANLARALLLDGEIEQTRQRLQSEFLSEDGREVEEERLEAQQEKRVAHLAAAEAALEDVLARPLQKDNPLALTELVLVLHAEEGRDAEAVPLAERALQLIDESTNLMRTSLEKTKHLSPTARVDYEKRLETNRDKELAMRDLLATAALNRGDTDAFLQQMARLESRELMGEVQYWNRAGVLEQLGRRDEAIADLERFLKLRSRRFARYEDDDLAPEVFRRIEALRGQPAAPPAP